VPVIMVHGWTSQDTNTPARTGAFSHVIDLSDTPGVVPDISRSLIGELQSIPGAAVFTFDYHPYSTRWVDDSHLGPALGKVIDCLYRASGQKVIIVAHSMGGLIARYAATHAGVTGSDRSGEISTVVTFGTPETGSIAALLAEAGVDFGAATSAALAVIRLVLSACGNLATNDIEAGSLCDELPTPIRAFESASGVALRAGSPELAALKSWPHSIYVDALAGNATFEVPRLGWFALPWSTRPVDVGDMIVTPSSALAGATSTKDATCDYQLNPVRGATDQLGLLFGQVAASQVAQQPLRAFTGACFHTDLMRGLELTAETVAVVAQTIRSAAAALTSTVVPVVKCPTTDTFPPSGHRLPATETIPVPAAVGSRLAYYSDATRRLQPILAPRGWSCSFAIGADASIAISIFPPGESLSRPGGPPTGTESVQAYYSSACIGCIDQEACPLVPHVARELMPSPPGTAGDCGPAQPSQQQQTWLAGSPAYSASGSDVVSVVDPPGIKGYVAGSGGPNPADGILLYWWGPATNPGASFADCTLPASAAPLCQTILKTFQQQHWTGY
jgi:pimeloyl-ACP methyl ester carboxylesterase